MADKVNLDALIPREDFDFGDEQNRTMTRPKDTFSINELNQGEFFYSGLRKPDFQRETSEWDAEKIVGLVESFISDDLIPAVILWRGGNTLTFVIDGSHRISALAAWVNDDYGDGPISRASYVDIPPDQQRSASFTRSLIRDRVGRFEDYKRGLLHPEQVGEVIAQRAKTLGSLAVQLQWVSGSAEKAEASFFKINQKASPIDQTELRILQSRRKPFGVAARAIMRSGRGTKYWSRFSDDNPKKIEDIAKEIHDILFLPLLTSPVRTLDLPIGGKEHSSQSLSLVFDFVLIANNIYKDDVRVEARKSSQQKTAETIFKEIAEDGDGQTTLNYLINCKNIIRRINSSHPGSLGLHPAVYFYSKEGLYKVASFFAVVSLVAELEQKKRLNSFTDIRQTFEDVLVKYDYVFQQIVRKSRSAIASYPIIKDVYLSLIAKLQEGKTGDLAVTEIVNQPGYSYINLTVDTLENSMSSAGNTDFSRETKSRAYITEALTRVIKCKICQGFLHINSMSVDHIQRKSDGGSRSIDNAQMVHPYCNTGYKH